MRLPSRRIMSSKRAFQVVWLITFHTGSMSGRSSSSSTSSAPSSRSLPSDALEGRAHVLGDERVAERGAVEDALALEVALGPGGGDVVLRHECRSTTDRRDAARPSPAASARCPSPCASSASHRCSCRTASATWLCGMTPLLCFSPTMPLAAAGMRVEPPPSVAMPIGPMPAATATAAPPLDPPDVCSALQALRVRPNSGASVSALWPNSGVVVLPNRIAPADFMRAARDRVFLRHVVLVQQRAEGRAHAGRVDEILGGEGDAVQQAERLALHDGVLGLPSPPRSACSATRVMKQFSTGCSFSARASTASVSSTGETFLAAICSRRGRRRAGG